MANTAGKKQKRPTKTDKRQSERFIATARKLEADESSASFERTFGKLVPAKQGKPVKEN
jgi:hypothetical protein